MLISKLCNSIWKKNLDKWLEFSPLKPQNLPSLCFQLVHLRGIVAQLSLNGIQQFLTFWIFCFWIQVKVNLGVKSVLRFPRKESFMLRFLPYKISQLFLADGTESYGRERRCDWGKPILLQLSHSFIGSETAFNCILKPRKVSLVC